MKITDLEIDGFGVWSGLKIEELSDRITVFYGPNEAGKTTLMQFIRSMFYGISPARRQRYLPPLRGGRPGGSLHVHGDEGAFQIARHTDDDRTDDTVTVTFADGTIQGDQLLQAALRDVDESVYNNVFAVGLREMQELGSLGDTDAAAWLYNLTAGLDRVSIVDVMTELEQSRYAIMAPDDRPSQVAELLDERERLAAEVNRLASDGRRWSQLARRAEKLTDQIAELQAESHQLKHQAQTIDIALTVKDKWQERAAALKQLEALGDSPQMPDGAVEKLDALGEQIGKLRRRRTQLRQERRRLRDEASNLGIDERLWRQAPRIEALGEQQQWIAALEQQAQEADAAAGAIQSQIDDRRRSLGLTVEASLPPAPQVSSQTLSLLRQPAADLRSARELCKSAGHEATTARATAAAITSQITIRLADVPERDLPDALDSAGNRVSQLRRRLGLDDRLDQLRRHEIELEEQGRELLEQQMMPAWILIGLGAVFVTGVVLVLSGLFLPTSVVGSLGMTLAVLGIVGTGVASLVKFLHDRSAANHLEACQKQLHLVGRQIGQTKSERQELDCELPRGGGPLATRLQTAERELAKLEELLPTEAERQMAEQEIAAATARGQRAKQEYDAAHLAWREALTTNGIPDHLSPKQVREFASHHDGLAELITQLAQSRQEAEHRRADYAALAGRVRQLATDVALVADGQTAVEQLREMLQQCAQQESKSRQLDSLRQRARELKREERQVVGRRRKLGRRHRDMLQQAGATDEPQFRQRALQAARAKLLERQRAGLDGEISAIVGDHTTEEHLATLLTDEAVEKLPDDQKDAADLLEANQKKLHEGLEEQGATRQQQQQLAEDRRLAERQLELSVVEQRLAEALETWQVRTVTWLLLESIRKEYEQNRQPETLTEASGYLRRLTDDHYVRVWTPLGEDVLYVEDAQGESLSVDVLSRGTREQLFLSLRLALVALVARRGTQLPLVLDDVLVNFDADRAKAAARVLRDFAKAGHQLLVFTCHEHVWKMFKAMKVDVRRLPDRTVAIAAETTDDRAPKPKVAPAAKSDVEVAAEEVLEEELSPVAADDAPDEADEYEEDEAESDDEYEEEDDEYEEEDEDEEEDEEEYGEDEYEEEDDKEEDDEAEAA